MRAVFFKGFTLVELMVVIAIMGLLVSIVIGSINGAKASARDIRRISDIKAIQIALTSYYNDNGHYPCQIYSNPSGPACAPGFVQAQYMSEVPTDPSSGNGTTIRYAYTALNAANSTNCVAAAAYVASYHLGAALENLMPSVTSTDKDETVGAEGEYGVCSGSTSKFDGAAKTNTACGGTAIANEDWCYDVTPDL